MLFVCTATSEQECFMGLPVEPIIWPIVSNMITGIKMSSLYLRQWQWQLRLKQENTELRGAHLAGK